MKCDTCRKRKTMQCPNSALCYATKDYPHYEPRSCASCRHITNDSDERYYECILGNDMDLRLCDEWLARDEAYGEQL